MVNENVTILLISSSKLLKNKFIECLNTEASQNHFTLMTKTIESLKSLSERINVPCLICDYLTDQSDSGEEQLQSCNIPLDTTYVQIVDATDKNLLNNLISRSMNKENANKKKFQFNVNGIVYLYDESNTDTFAYVESIHRELNSSSTFKEYLDNESLRFLMCNMINATIATNSNTTDCSLKLIEKTENFLNGFNNNIQYVTQAFEETILGSKPIPQTENSNDQENNLKNNFDEMIKRFNIRLDQSLNRTQRHREKESDESYKIINSMTDSMGSVKDENIRDVVRDSKMENSKKNYQGEMQNNLRNGFGIYVYENKFFRYEGEWKNGRKHGMGKLCMKDGSYYEGEFKNGEICGKGYKLNKFKESEYTGDFLEGLYHGKGTLRVRKLYTYQGDFYENMRHGYGEFNEFKVNRHYQGQWYYNKRHGQGIQRFSDGSTYTGDWIRDKRQGHGEMEFADGSYYDGQWRNDLINGTGIYKHFTGYYFDGLFTNGVPNKIPCTKLALSIDIQPEDEEHNNKIMLHANSNFSVTVKAIINENEEDILSEDGRKIQLSFGIKLDVSNTAKYENSIATEFGFAIIPILLENNSINDINNILELKNQSTIVDESQTNKLMAPSSTNENELINNLKNELGGSSDSNSNKEGGGGGGVILENSQYMVDSYSSKILEVTSPNNNGCVKFETLSVDNIKIQDKTFINAAAKKAAKLGPNKGSYNCVIIAEDCSEPLLFGNKLPSTYLECVFNNIDAKIGQKN